MSIAAKSRPSISLGLERNASPLKDIAPASSPMMFKRKTSVLVPTIMKSLKPETIRNLLMMLPQVIGHIRYDCLGMDDLFIKNVEESTLGKALDALTNLLGKSGEASVERIRELCSWHGSHTWARLILEIFEHLSPPFFPPEVAETLLESFNGLLMASSDAAKVELVAPILNNLASWKFELLGQIVALCRDSAAPLEKLVFRVGPAILASGGGIINAEAEASSFTPRNGQYFKPNLKSRMNNGAETSYAAAQVFKVLVNCSYALFGDSAACVNIDEVESHLRLDVSGTQSKSLALKKRDSFTNPGTSASPALKLLSEDDDPQLASVTVVNVNGNGTAPTRRFSFNKTPSGSIMNTSNVNSEYTTEELHQLKTELREFYEWRDPAKVSKVDILFQEYSFDEIALAVRERYGVLPKGWRSNFSDASPKRAARLSITELSSSEQKALNDLSGKSDSSGGVVLPPPGMRPPLPTQTTSNKTKTMEDSSDAKKRSVVGLSRMERSDSTSSANLRDIKRPSMLESSSLSKHVISSLDLKDEEDEPPPPPPPPLTSSKSFRDKPEPPKLPTTVNVETAVVAGKRRVSLMPPPGVVIQDTAKTRDDRMDSIEDDWSDEERDSDQSPKQPEDRKASLPPLPPPVSGKPLIGPPPGLFKTAVQAGANAAVAANSQKPAPPSQITTSSSNKPAPPPPPPSATTKPSNNPAQASTQTTTTTTKPTQTTTTTATTKPAPSASSKPNPTSESSANKSAATVSSKLASNPFLASKSEPPTTTTSTVAKPTSQQQQPLVKSGTVPAAKPASSGPPVVPYFRTEDPVKLPKVAVPSFLQPKQKEETPQVVKTGKVWTPPPKVEEKPYQPPINKTGKVWTPPPKVEQKEEPKSQVTKTGKVWTPPPKPVEATKPAAISTAAQPTTTKPVANSNNNKNTAAAITTSTTTTSTSTTTTTNNNNNNNNAEGSGWFSGAVDYFFSGSSSSQSGTAINQAAQVIQQPQQQKQQSIQTTSNPLDDWIPMFSEEYQRYYYENVKTGQTTWDDPGFGMATSSTTITQQAQQQQGQYGKSSAPSNEAAATPQVYNAQVMWDYYPQNPSSGEELALYAGDHITVYHQGEDGWFEGICLRDGSSGRFPGSYVQFY